MVLQECMLLSVRLCVGLTMPCPVIMEPTLEITAPSMDTLATFVKLGWTGKYQIFRGREMELGNMAGSLRDRFKDSHNARSTGESLRPHSLTFQTGKYQIFRGREMELGNM